jgi:hypothetical protein
MGAASAAAPRSRATPAADLPRIGLPLTWTKKENIRIVGFAPQENELLVWLIRTSGTAGPGPSAEHLCTGAACCAAIRSLPISAVDGDRPGGSERHASDPTRRSAGQAARLPAIPASEQRDGEAPEASIVNDAAVAAYRLSVQAGNPLSERRPAQMFGRTSRRWARARIADARKTSLVQDSSGAAA